MIDREWLSNEEILLIQQEVTEKCETADCRPYFYLDKKKFARAIEKAVVAAIRARGTGWGK